MKMAVAAALAVVWAGTSSAHAGTCGLDPNDCDDDGFSNEVDLCPFTASADNSPTTLTYFDAPGTLPTGAACTDPGAMVSASARLGHGVELGSGATVLEYAFVGDFTQLGGHDEAAVLARRAVLVDAPTPEQGTVFRSGVIGARSALGGDPSEPFSDREGGVVTGLDFSASRAATIGFGATLGDGVVLGYGAVIGPRAIIGDRVVVGALAEVGFGTILGDGVVVARAAEIGAGSQLGDGVIVGPEVRIGTGTLIEGSDDGGRPVRLRKQVVIGSCVTVEEGAAIGRGADVADHAMVGSDTSLSAHTTVEQGGTACTGEGTRNGHECRDRFTRGDHVGGDPENTTCPEIIAPTPDADLSVDPFTLSARTPAGFQVPVTLTVRNTGLDPVGATYLDLAWTQNGQWTDTACRLAVDPVSGDSSRTLGTSCDAPATPGNYRLIARVDATERAVERDEANNDRASSVIAVQVIDSACGASAGDSFLSAPDSALCAFGDASVVSGSGPFSWTCTSEDAVASCAADRSCASTTPDWTVSGSQCDGTLASGAHDSNQSIDDTVLPTSGSRAYTCDQGTWVPDDAGTCVTAEDAVCGTADGGSSASAPSTALCAAGTPTAVTGSGPYTWQCEGRDGGLDATCSSNKSCDASGHTWSVSGSSCSGSVSAVSHGGSQVASDAGLPTTGSRTYTCSQGSWSGSGTGSCVTAVYGACGVADGGSTASAPSTGLCADGTPSTVSGSGPYTWTCAGSDGGTTASCSSHRSCGAEGQDWTVSGSSCSASTTAVAHGGSRTATDAGLPTTGSRTYTCSEGSWSGSGTGTCVTAVDGACGGANGGSTASAPATGLCSSGSASAVSGTGPYSWSCTGTDGGSTASCSSNRSCGSTGQSWSVSGSSCSGSVSAVSHGGSQVASDASLPTTGSRTYTCSQGSWAGSGTGSCVTAVYGACGSANGGSTSSAPSTNLCSSGQATSVSGSGPYSWSCTGSNGGTTASCSSHKSCGTQSQSWTVSGSTCSASASAVSHGGSRSLTDSGLPTTGSRTYVCSEGGWNGSGTGSCVTAVNGACGSANGGSTSGAPSSNLCSSGSASGVSGSGPYSWSCTGSNGGTTASCSSNRSCGTQSQSWTVSGSTCTGSASGTGHGGSRSLTDSGLPTTGSRTYVCSQGSWNGSGTGSCVTAVNGSCGSANGGSTTGAPSSNLCSSGSASGVSGSGPYSWSCTGSNGGSTASCSSNRSCTTQSQSWTVSGSTCSGTASGISHGGSRGLTDSGLPTTGSRTYVCSQGGWNGSGTGSCVTAVNGSCGSANGGNTTSAPSSNLCSSGSATGVSGSGPYSWSCTGSNGGSTASCSSNRSCGGITGSWTISGSTCSASVPATNHGGNRTVSDTGQPTTGSRNYSCSQGSWSNSGGSCVTRINGSCGSAESGSSTSAPSSSLCSAGSASSVSIAGDGRWAWTCSGTNGGSTDTCRKNRSCSGATVSWGSCNRSMSSQSHGYSSSLSNTRSGYTGSATIACSQGTWVTSNTSCRVNQVCSPGETRYCTVRSCPCEPDGTQRCNSDGSAWLACQPGPLCYGGGGGCY